MKVSELLVTKKGQKIIQIHPLGTMKVRFHGFHLL